MLPHSPTLNLMCWLLRLLYCSPTLFWSKLGVSGRLSQHNFLTLCMQQNMQHAFAPQISKHWSLPYKGKHWSLPYKGKPELLFQIVFLCIPLVCLSEIIPSEGSSHVTACIELATMFTFNLVNNLLLKLTV